MLTKTAKTEWTSDAAPSHRRGIDRCRSVGLLAIVGLLTAVSTMVLVCAMALGATFEIARRLRVMASARLRPAVRT